MKDPIEEFEKQTEKLDEIFGFLRRAFGSKPSTTPSSFLDAMNRYKDTDSDADCAKMDVGNKLNRKVGGSVGSKEIVIGTNKIGNIKGLRFELLDSKGKGTGKFDNAIVSDFKCYDTDKDIYGIKWLFDDSAKFEAESITGDLKANKKNQSLNFHGKWMEGKFYGRFFSGPENFKGIAAPSATFAFFDYGNKKSPSTTRKKSGTKKKTGKQSRKITSTGNPPTPPPTPLAIPPAPPTPPPAPVTPAAQPPSAKGGKGKKLGLKENTSAESPKTIRAFLDTFM